MVSGFGFTNGSVSAKFHDGGLSDSYGPYVKHNIDFNYDCEVVLCQNWLREVQQGSFSVGVLKWNKSSFLPYIYDNKNMAPYTGKDIDIFALAIGH